MFKKILIANRGEIACRVIKTARRLGIHTVAVYSEADKNARHVRLADEAYHIGGAASADSYLKGDVIIDVAKQAGAEAIHPGYGFLSENEAFALSCEKAGIKFIGPSGDSIRAMGLKDRAKDLMREAGVPVVPGYQGKDQDAKFLQKQAKEIGYPVLIKAVAGGGGKGMRLVENEKDFAEALASCKREAKASFSNDHVLIEKYITRPRHVEVQVFGDGKGSGVHLFERDCSLQRRHQKVVEEAPAPGLKDKTRKALGEAAVKAVEALKYENAGTIEFIMDSKTQDFFFMEMNTRLQVEHPVTEMITGQDLVEWQLRVAAGEGLPLTQDEVRICGHAFEVRLYAEDPSNEFLPQTGKVDFFEVMGEDSFVRLDTAVESGDVVSIHYDPMIAKLIVSGADRETALQRMHHALEHTALSGVKTNQEFLSAVFAQKDFMAGKVDTGFIERHARDLIPESYGQAGTKELALAAVYFLSGLNRPAQGSDPWDSRDNWRMNGVLNRTLKLVNKGEEIEVQATCYHDRYQLVINGKSMTARFVSYDNKALVITLDDVKLGGILVAKARDLTIFVGGRVVSVHLYVQGSAQDDGASAGRIMAPMPGKIIDVMVGQGDMVEKDQPLLVMEAMKMEMTIRAGCDGIIDELPVAVNDQVEDGTLLVSIKNEDVA